MDTDGFWGTSRASQAAPPDSQTYSRNPSADRPWYSGDNWNGKILAVVREQMRELLKDEVEKGEQACCEPLTAVLPANDSDETWNPKQ